MEEILFESTHTMNNELFKETGKFVIFKRKPTVFLHILILIFIPFFLFAHISGFYENMMTIYSSYILIGLYAFIVFFSYYNFTVLQHKRKNELAQGNDEVVTVQITENRTIFSSSIGTKSEIEFSSFKRIDETKNYIILTSKTKQMYILDKRKFNKGTPDSLIAFLKSKGIK
ncbi:MAG: YcxB family protein [Clostridia bacterium]|nr:YcxB family protein [Clostridia bacterium]